MEQIKKRRLHGTSSQYFHLVILIVFISLSCDQPDKQIQRMQSRIDSLQNELKNAYRPGLGEFMLAIQLHHAKLWFAGQNQNWPLADFEVHEILESLDDIRQFCQD